MEKSVVVGPEDSVVVGYEFVDLVEELGQDCLVEVFGGDAQAELLNLMSYTME